MSRELLYVGLNGYVVAVDPGSGTERWRTKLETGAVLGSATRYNDVTLLVHDDTVLCGCAGHLFGLDAASGRVRWHNRLEGLQYNDVTLAMRGTTVQVISSAG